MMDQDELIVVFVEESVEHLASIEPDLLDMEKNIDNINPDVVNRIFRAVHSVKGAAGFFGFNNVSELAHIMENLLAKVRDKKLPASSHFIDALLGGLDTLRAMLDDVNASQSFDIQPDMDRLNALMGDPKKSAKVVTVKEIPKSGEQPKAFDIREDELKRFAQTGHFLYTIQIALKTDLKDKGRTPLDLIKTITSTGELIESRLVFDQISGLNDCLEKEIFFVFAFATIMDIELVSQTLEIPNESVWQIDIKPFEPPVNAERIKELIARKKASPSSGASPPAPRASHRPGLKPGLEKNTDFEKRIGPAVQVEEKIRIGIGFLNDLVNMAGEMVLGRNQLNQIVQPLVKDTPGLNPVIQHISRITTEMQEKIMQMRMQPVSNIFGKFHRVVRDLARKLDKEIELVTIGDDVELDRSIIEALSDPLTHLIRNSVDHGMEFPVDREKQGKPRQGTIQLKAYHQAGHVYIDIIDDGRGIDCQRVAEKAVEKELVTREQVSEMGDRELAKLIFKPGFSTASQVSDISGRGVGMDVVQTNIAQIGGTVDIDTRLGQGTTISLVLPLTLAIVSGLVIRTGKRFFILPEVNVDELVRVKPEEIKTRINMVQNARVLRLRDMLLPLVSLRQVLNLDGSDESLFSGQAKEPMRVLIVKHGASQFGLLVDVIENIEEIVVKPLPLYLKNQLCFSGTSIMGNGEVALILDVGGMFKKAGLHHKTLTRQEEEAGTALQDATQDLQTLLLFDNGTAERFALPLEQITRIEQISVKDIENINDRHYLQYQGDKLRLVFLEDYLPVSRPEPAKDGMVRVIIPKQVKYPMGIVIRRVQGTISAQVKIDIESITGPGLFGSTILEGKITLLPDMYRLFELAAPERQATPAHDENLQRSKRILLVEDTPFFRMIEKDFLVSAGYDVLEAENGRQAMDLLGEEQVDAVILDIVMPVMDGWEVIRAIRESDRLRTLPVMAVTSLGYEIDTARGLEAGFDQWEAKLNKERLLEKVARLLHPSKEVA